MPNGTLLGCTFDLPLVEDLYEMAGREMRQNRVDALLGPGMNIHRNPLCGRNFEYYSEDPLVAGMCAAADTEESSPMPESEPVSSTLQPTTRKITVCTSMSTSASAQCVKSI